MRAVLRARPFLPRAACVLPVAPLRAYYVSPCARGGASFEERKSEVVIKDGMPFRDGWRIFTRDEVGRHNRYSDGWVVKGDGVYNVTTWLPYHPGGEKILLPLLGKDITFMFVGRGHSRTAEDTLEKHRVGVVADTPRYSGWDIPETPKDFGVEGGFY